MEDIDIRVWVEEKKTRWAELLDLWHQYWVFEPLNSGIPGLTEPETKKKLSTLFHDMMTYDDTPFIVAVDKKTEKVVGFVLSFIEYPKGKHPIQVTDKAFSDYEKYKFPSNVKERLEALASFLEQLLVKGDVFNKFGVEKIWLIEITTVHQDYTRRGIANAMTAKLLTVARDMRLPLVVSESTSKFTQQSKIRHFNFETICESVYANDYAHYDAMPGQMKKTHSSAFLLAKKLD